MQRSADTNLRGAECRKEVPGILQLLLTVVQPAIQIEIHEKMTASQIFMIMIN
jgi:hypothetical protein